MTGYRHTSDLGTGGVSSIWAGDRHMSEVTEGLTSTVRLIRQCAVFMLIWVLAWIGIGVAYIKLVRPEFVATTQIALQPRQIINEGPEDFRHYHQFMIDNEQCETELRILRSEQLLYGVFEMLNLSKAPEIRGGANGLWSLLTETILNWELAANPRSGEILDFYRFSDRIRSRRLGLSYVIDISYRANSGEQAARVANTIAAAYVSGRLRATVARAQGGTYRESRMKSLESQILIAETGARLGVIPESNLPDSDVRLLGSANVPLARAYPKAGPLLVMMGAIGLVSGALIIMLYGLKVDGGRSRRKFRREFPRVNQGAISRVPAGRQVHLASREEASCSLRP